MPPRVNALVHVRRQRWRVLRTTSYPASTTLEVVGAGAENRGQNATFVLPFEPCEVVQVHPSPRRVARRTWRRLIRHALANAVPAPESLRTAASARFTPLPYQLEPVQSYLRGDAVRLLIADGVGMGKTIQAGLLVSETVARHVDARVLIVVPAPLRTQWLDEMRERFGLDAAVMDAAGLGRLSSGLPAGISPWATCGIAITSIDFVKRAEVMRALDGLVWDLVVFDEAHTLAGRSDRHVAASGLAVRAGAVVLLTATPHSGDHDAFARLCTLGDIENRFPLEVFRRERTDLATNPLRRSRWFAVRPAEADVVLQALLLDYARKVWHEAATPGAHLAMVVLLKRGASSATALARSLIRRRALLAASPSPPVDQPLLPFDPDDDNEPGSEVGSPGFTNRREELGVLDTLIGGCLAASALARKVSLLQRLLRRTHEPVLLFTQYRDTLDDLRQALVLFTPVCLHGGMSARERLEAVRAFTNGHARVLLATDAASEGLNLHARCRLVASVDLPWTPLRMEQRVGRVDRIGQTRRVHAWQLIAAGSYETSVAERVRARANAARTALDAIELEDESTTAAELLTGHATVPTPGRWPKTDPARASTGRQRAVAEAGRIQVARALGEHASTSAPERPYLATFRGRPATVVAAYRATYGDPSGGYAFDTIVGVVTSHRGAENVHLTLTHGQLAAQATCLVPRDFRALRRMAAIGLRRRRAIERSIRDERARLSGALLQRTLLTNRMAQHATAQSQLLEKAVTRLRERATQLRAVGRLALESISLVCAAAWR